jgi:hypothetical protein
MDLRTTSSDTSMRSAHISKLASGTTSERRTSGHTSRSGLSATWRYGRPSRRCATSHLWTTIRGGKSFPLAIHERPRIENRVDGQEETGRAPLPRRRGQRRRVLTLAELNGSHSSNDRPPERRLLREGARPRHTRSASRHRAAAQPPQRPRKREARKVLASRAPVTTALIREPIPEERTLAHPRDAVLNPPRAPPRR